MYTLCVSARLACVYLCHSFIRFISLSVSLELGLFSQWNKTEQNEKKRIWNIKVLVEWLGALFYAHNRHTNSLSPHTGLGLSVFIFASLSVRAPYMQCWHSGFYVIECGPRFAFNVLLLPVFCLCSATHFVFSVVVVPLFCTLLFELVVYISLSLCRCMCVAGFFSCWFHWVFVVVLESVDFFVVYRLRKLIDVNVKSMIMLLLLRLFFFLLFLSLSTFFLLFAPVFYLLLHTTDTCVCVYRIREVVKWYYRCFHTFFNLNIQQPQCEVCVCMYIWAHFLLFHIHKFQSLDDYSVLCYCCCRCCCWWLWCRFNRTVKERRKKRCEQKIEYFEWNESNEW